MTPKSSVRRVAIHVPDADIMTTVLRGAGFRASCECGYKGARRGSYAEARKDSRLHRFEAHT